MDRRHQGSGNVKDNLGAGNSNTKRRRHDDGPDQAASSSMNAEPQQSAGNPSSSSASEASAPKSGKNQAKPLQATNSSSPPRVTHPGVFENLSKALREKAVSYAAAGLDRETCQRNSMLDFGKCMVELCERHGTFDNYVAYLNATNPVGNDTESSDN